MPAGTVETKDRAGTRSDGEGDFSQMRVHRPGVGDGQDQTGGDTASRTDGGEQTGPLIAGILRGAGPGSAPCPETRELQWSGLDLTDGIVKLR